MKLGFIGCGNMAQAMITGIFQNTLAKALQTPYILQFLDVRIQGPSHEDTALPVYTLTSLVHRHHLLAMDA